MKKIITLCLTLVLLTLCFSGCGKSDINPTGNTQPVTDVTFSGTGTEADPYRITTAEDLWCMAELVNSENEAYRDACYVLTADIDLGGKTWTPIGDGYLDSFKSFPGTFDGDGHTISGLNITTQDKVRYFGLFGMVEGAVRNLTIASSTIEGSASTGAVAGRIDFGGTIDNCHVAADVTITGSYTTGALVGEMAGTMADCTNAGTVICTSEVGTVGGLIGQVSGYHENDGTVENCTNYGTVQTGRDAGGVAGSLLGGKINNCVNEGAVSGENAGGIVGLINAAQTNDTVGEYVISSCANSGSVTAVTNSDTERTHAGGIAAEAVITTGNVKITDCANSGSLLGDHMGGILCSGSTSTPYATLSVSNCTNSAELINEEDDGGNSAGGIIADLTGKDGGSFTIAESRNTGAIDVRFGVAGGILASYTSSWPDDEDVSVTLDIVNCTNDASISGGSMGIGGIVADVSAPTYPAVIMNVSSCSNAGDLYGRGACVRIGGIVGAIEPHHCTAVFTDCGNTGNLTCEEVTITKEEEWFGFNAAMGGILGYAGVYGTRLDPEDDCGLNGATVLTFDGCSNTGTITPVNEKVEYFTGDICGLSVAGTDIH